MNLSDLGRPKRDASIIVTKDEDAARMMLRFGTPPQVMRLRIGGATNRALPTWLAPVLPNAR